jgi:hypothetical protein
MGGGVMGVFIGHSRDIQGMQQDKHGTYRENFGTNDIHLYFRYFMLQKRRQFYSRGSHIEYLMVCEGCQGEYWAKKKDSKCCCDACRKMVQREKKKDSVVPANKQ